MIGAMLPDENMIGMTSLQFSDDARFARRRSSQQTM